MVPGARIGKSGLYCVGYERWGEGREGRRGIYLANGL